jgi:hypothetical protein
MSNYYRTYYFSSYQEEEQNQSIAFIIVTDGDRTEILFPETATENTIETLSQAIGARLAALEELDIGTDAETAVKEILEIVTYNMQVNFYIDEEGMESYPSFDDALSAAKEELIDDYSSEDFKPKSYKPVLPKDEAITAAGKSCPPATQDIALNLKNRKNAIDTAMYGPLNPGEPNDEYWQALGSEWGVDVETAKQQRCGNCAVFIITTSMKSCISEGLTGENQSDEFEAIDEAGELGYCEAFDFKCASARTCRAWVSGGPIDDSKVKE